MAAEFTISIIDDDLSLQTALARLVRSLGYAARGFSSAEDFLAAGMMHGSACVITDVHMPGMSGIDLKQHMNDQGCTVPVIMITAHTDPGLEDAAAASGAQCFLRKPVDAKMLAECLGKALQA